MQKGFALPVVLIGILIILVISGGFLIYKNHPPLNSLNKKTSLYPVTKTVVVNENYDFSFNVPDGYSVENGEGDYTNYIVDSKGNILIGFITHFTGGETGSRSEIILDSVSFLIGGGKEIGCPQDISSKHYTKTLAISIVTWCDGSSQQKSVYKDVIESIKFNNQLKEALLSNEDDQAISETANWKTYTTEDKIFNFKYPSDWIYEKQNTKVRFGDKEYDAIYIATGVPLTKEEALGAPSNIKNKRNFSLLYATNNDFRSLTLDDLAKYLIGVRAEIDSQKDLQLGENIQAREVSYPCQEGCSDILFKNNNTIFDVSTGSWNGYYDPSQILSTFKFLADETANWKIINDRDNVFSFKLPEDWEYGTDIFTKPGAKPLREWITESGNFGFKINSEQKTLVKGREALILEAQAAPHGRSLQIYILRDSGSVVRLTANPLGRNNQDLPPFDEETKNIFQKIISTIQFLR